MSAHFLHDKKMVIDETKLKQLNVPVTKEIVFKTLEECEKHLSLNPVSAEEKFRVVYDPSNLNYFKRHLYRNCKVGSGNEIKFQNFFVDIRYNRGVTNNSNPMSDRIDISKLVSKMTAPVRFSVLLGQTMEECQSKRVETVNRYKKLLGLDEVIFECELYSYQGKETPVAHIWNAQGVDQVKFDRVLFELNSFSAGPVCKEEISSSNYEYVLSKDKVLSQEDYTRSYTEVRRIEDASQSACLEQKSLFLDFLETFSAVALKSDLECQENNGKFSVFGWYDLKKEWSGVPISKVPEFMSKVPTCSNESGIETHSR